jgi:hypothetical protein
LALCCVLAAAVLGAGLLAAQERADRVAAQAKLESVCANPTTRRLAAEPIRQARAALRRGEDARASGDHVHGAMLEALGLQWAGVAEAVGRAADMEREAAKAQRRVAEAETKTIRAKALLEQTVARRGRAQEKLKRLEQGGGASGTNSGGEP